MEEGGDIHSTGPETVESKAKKGRRFQTPLIAASGQAPEKEQPHEGPGYYPYGGYLSGGGHESSGGELDARAMIRLFLAYKWVAAGIITAALITGLLLAFLATPVYEARASVFIDRGASRAADKDVSGVAAQLKDEIYFASQLDILQSRQVAQMAFDSLGLKDAPPFKNAANPLKSFRDHIKIERRRDSAIFDIKAESPNKQIVASWANAVANSYVKFVLDLNVQFIKDANGLIEQQAKELQQKYSSTKQEYGEKLAQEGIYYPQNQKQILDQRITSLEARKSDLLIKKQDVAAAVAELAAVRDGRKDPLAAASVRNDPVVQGLAQQYSLLEKELSKMLAQFTPQYPPYVKKSAELADLKERIRSQALLILSAQEGQLSALGGEKASLDRELQDLKGEAIQVTSSASSLEGQGSGVDALQKYVAIMSEKMQQMDVASKLMESNVRVIDRAVTPQRPSKPNKRMTVLLSLFLGVMASAGTIWGIHFFDTRVKETGALERATGVPIIGLVPSYNQENKGLVVEAFQTLRTSLLYASDHKKRNVLMVTSSASGEGKSACVTNLGIVLADCGDSVLIVDGDLRKSSIHKFFKLESKRGLSEYLAEPRAKYEDFLLPTSYPGLMLMPGGGVPPNPPALFSMGAFRDFILAARSKFGWVLVDTPPILAVTDANIIGEVADLALVVVSYNTSHLPLVQESLEQLRRQDHEVAGLVMNRYEWRNRYYYNHYHYYQGGGAREGGLAKKLAVRFSQTGRGRGAA